MTSLRYKSLEQTPSPILAAHTKCSDDPFSPQNPKGYINFGIAENHLMDDYLLPKLAKPIGVKSEHLQYCDLAGLASTRKVFGDFLERYLGITNIDRDKLIINCGVSAICESLSFSLFDRDDIILVPTPYYNGFVYDFTKRFGCKFRPVHLNSQTGFTHSLDAFTKSEIKEAKAVLITHPHNPSGEILSSQFQEDVVNYCLEHNLVLISDEIYALSEHHHNAHQSLFEKASQRGVKSILLYGLAKDFCLAGFKVGLAYSHNKEIVAALKSLSYFHPVGTPTQLLVEGLLSDTQFLKDYIPEMQKRLRLAKEKITHSLPTLKFIQASSGMFLLLDLSGYCKTLNDEAELFDKLINQYRINITPGQEQGLNTPGYFRVCYARKAESIDEFIRRMKIFLLETKTP